MIFLCFVHLSFGRKLLFCHAVIYLLKSLKFLSQILICISALSSVRNSTAYLSTFSLSRVSSTPCSVISRTKSGVMFGFRAEAIGQSSEIVKYLLHIDQGEG